MLILWQIYFICQTTDVPNVWNRFQPDILHSCHNHRSYKELLISKDTRILGAL